MLAVFKAIPMRRLSRPCETERRALGASSKFADVVFDARTLARNRRHAFGKLGWFVAHPYRLPRGGALSASS
ncbi:hypothetical protein EN933_04745 [Mesorhizobium sp. M7A.F.Ca.US.001.01.1.1]|nr:hypothetical protein EN933_04745 [Mesorhizobium sp. M7A.F.Ca.US.001.01.1.1]